jgi:hypothetical protein
MVPKLLDDHTSVPHPLFSSSASKYVLPEPTVNSVVVDESDRPQTSFPNSCTWARPNVASPQLQISIQSGRAKFRL